jgi:hypothetical protein
LLLAEYSGGRLPVVAVEKSEPVVLVNGTKKVLHGNIPLSTERAPRFAGPRAALEIKKVEILQLVSASSELAVEEAASSPRATLGGYVEFAATVTAAQDLADCYVVLFAFDEGFLDGGTDRPNAQIRIRQIPNLRAGEATPVKFSSTPLLSRSGMKVFALLFSGGNEVATGSRSFAGRYFHRRECVIHAAADQRWLEENRTGDRPGKPALQIPPLFESTSGFPADLTADLTVAADGTVMHVGLNRTLPPAAETMIERSLGAWLFLPRIEAGKAAMMHVAVPLRF